MQRRSVLLPALAALALSATQAKAAEPGLWSLWSQTLAHAKYIDLTHTVTPDTPVWHGFGPSKFSPTTDPKTSQPYTYEKDGFEATHYDLSTDQLGTQLDPPAHWAPEYPSIDELPPTYAIRPLVVISITGQVAKNPGYALQTADVKEFEQQHGPIPAGAVVFVRSDWSKRWPDPSLSTETEFPGVSLDALKYLHEDRRILMHGHEPLDTDTTPTLEGEHWLMHHGFTQAEGVANLDQVPPTGCLVSIGYPKLKGGTGGYARYVAICPADTEAGVAPGPADAPLPKSDHPLHWDKAAGTRIR